MTNVPACPACGCTMRFFVVDEKLTATKAHFECLQCTDYWSSDEMDQPTIAAQIVTIGARAEHRCPLPDRAPMNVEGTYPARSARSARATRRTSRMGGA